MSTLLKIYRDYLECLNNQAWDDLPKFIDDKVCYNDQEIGLDGYRSMLEQNYRDIPDLYFKAELLVANSTHVASRLQFNCSPTGVFMDLPINGRRVHFSENVFYQIHNDKITKVWSVIDKVSLEKQLIA